MKGWKTWLSAIALFCTGVGMVIYGLMADSTEIDRVAQGLTMMSGAGAMVGFGHKMEKNAAKKIVIKADQLKKLLKE